MKKLFLWVATISWVIIIWRLTTSEQLVVTDKSWLQNILMMVAHFSFFGVQAVLFHLALPSQPLTIFYPPLILTSLYGALIEYRQLSVPGRSADIFDWLLDTLGAIVFLAIIKKYLIHKS